MDNIIRNNMMYDMEFDSISYFYQISPFKNLTADKNEIDAYLSVFNSIIKTVNMPGGIIIIPKLISIDDRKLWYYNHIDKYGIESLKDIAKEKVDTSLVETKNKKENIYILYFIDNRQNLKKQSKIKGTNKHRTVKEIEKLFLKFNVLSDTIYSNITNVYRDVVKVSSEMLKFDILQVLDFPVLNTKSINDKFLIPKIDHVEYNYKVNGKEKKAFSRFLTVRNFEDLSNYGSQNMATILNTTIPVQMHVKFSLELDKALEVTVEQHKYRVLKDVDNFIKHNEKKDYETEKELNKLNYIAKQVQDNEIEKTLVKFQMYFRISSFTKNDCYELCKVFTDDLEQVCQVDYLNGRQEVAYYNFKPQTNSILTNVITTDLRYFSNLNLLGSNIGGSVQGWSLLEDYYSTQEILLNLRSIREGKTKTSSTTGVIVGSTGSGKSMMAFLLMDNLTLIEGLKGIFVYPKGDKIEFEKTSTYDNRINIYRIGDAKDDSNRGILDPFSIYKNDLNQALFEAKNILNMYSKSKNIKYDENVTNQCFSKLENVDRKTFKKLITEMAEMEETTELATYILSRSIHYLDGLFFANDDSKELDFTNIINIIQITNLKSIAVFDDCNIEHILTQHILETIKNSVKDYCTNVKDYIVFFDENARLKQYPALKNISSELAKEMRSSDVFPMFASQNPSDFDEEFFNNVGYSFIGRLNSKKEIEYAKRAMNISNFAVDFLNELRTTSRANDLGKYQEYPFVFTDYYGNTSIVEAVNYRRDIFEVFNDAKKV